jgi:1-acyl-sn-glycerol-3-phosphate acyltransferase
MISIRSYIYYVLLYAVTIGMGVCLLPALVFPVRVARAVASLWAGVLLGMLRAVCGVHWRIEGREHMPAQPVIYASKHQSAWETLAFFVILKHHPMFVLKRELLLLPFIGWYLRKIGSIAIDRKAGAGALKGMTKQAKAALENGHDIIVFPEGTRVPPGQTRAFNPGVAALYAQTGSPVVPVALNSGLCWKRHSVEKKPGMITMRFLPPIPPGLPPREFLKQLETAINEATQALGLQGAV